MSEKPHFQIKIENKIEDYIALYPDYRKNYFARDKWILISLGLLVLIVTGLVIGLMRPRFDEISVASTGFVSIGFFSFLIYRIHKLWSFDNHLTKWIAKTKADGAFDMTLNLKGIVLEYETRYARIAWDSILDYVFESEYLLVRNFNQEIELIVTRGTIQPKEWVQIEKNMIEIAEQIMLEKVTEPEKEM